MGEGWERPQRGSMREPCGTRTLCPNSRGGGPEASGGRRRRELHTHRLGKGNGVEDHTPAQEGHCGPARCPAPGTPRHNHVRTATAFQP